MCQHALEFPAREEVKLYFSISLVEMYSSQCHGYSLDRKAGHPGQDLSGEPDQKPAWLVLMLL